MRSEEFVGNRMIGGAGAPAHAIGRRLSIVALEDRGDRNLWPKSSDLHLAISFTSFPVSVRRNPCSVPNEQRLSLTAIDFYGALGKFLRLRWRRDKPSANDFSKRSR